MWEPVYVGVDGINTARKFPYQLPAELQAVGREHGPAVALVSYLAELRCFEFKGADDCEPDRAEYVLENGALWTSTTHPVRPYPRGYPKAPADDRPGGCGKRAEYLAGADRRLTPYTGWLVFHGPDCRGGWTWPDTSRARADDDLFYVWGHCWVATPRGLYIDRVCGLPEGWAAAGHRNGAWAA